MLKRFRIARLLLNLPIIVLTQIADTIFKSSTSLRHILDPQLELLVERVEIRAGLKLPTITRDNLVVDALSTPDVDLGTAARRDRHRVLDDM